jgi:hypothetical protein
LALADAVSICYKLEKGKGTMITYDIALRLIQDSLDSLQRAGLIEQEIVAQDDTVILGSGSTLDSIAFVTFVTELEDRLNREENQEELFLVLQDIHDFNTANSSLSAGTFAHYLVKLTKEKA